jgi:anaerobic dimethyl sulfoxide reductase subunit A
VGADKAVYTTCNSHCGGTCLLKVHVRKGVITRIETDDGEEPQFRACARGRAYRQRVYDPERLMFPLKRVGERGEGKFERISWDEALDTVAREIKRVRETYGSEAILMYSGFGDIDLLHSRVTVDRLLSMAGGHSRVWGSISYEAGVFAELATYGTSPVDSTRDDLLNARLIILWGCDPAITVHNTNTSWYLTQAKEAGIKIISVDPRYTVSTATFASQWIPVIPGTDAAMLIAMAYAIIKQNLQNQTFLDTYTIGFQQFKDYVLGIEDRIAKTPAWAESITGVPAATIERLAVEYATTKPSALIAGIAPGRTAYGEQYHRAAMTLAAMTGNIGTHGGDAAGRSWNAGNWGLPLIKLGKLTTAFNPVEDRDPPPPDALFRRRGHGGGWARVNSHQITDAILKGKSGGYPADYKLLYLINRNYLNQSANTNRIIKALKSLEFIAAEEQLMTPTAKFCDILLPTNTFMERNDITYGGATPIYACMNKVIGSLGESKSQFDIANELARRMGIPDYTDKTEEEWLKEFTKESDIPDYDKFRETGIYKVKPTEPYVAFKEQVDDPNNKRFPTPSGKIEIYSQRMADLNNPKLPPIPKYIETWESRNDRLVKRYPLQAITTHFKRRAHTQYEKIPWLRELQTQAIFINPVDAAPRGIKDGDQVRVFNDRGEMIISATLTERIMPGVIDIPQGAWYDPDQNGVDRGGCANVLTRDEPSPAKAFTPNTCLVQVQKA